MSPRYVILASKTQVEALAEVAWKYPGYRVCFKS